MAETARTWAILEALQARLQGITTTGGAYRTDAGADVRLEPSQLGAGERITLYSGGTVADDDRNTKQREFTLIVEACVPVTLANAQARVVAIAEDIEDALTDYVAMPAALPLRFAESIFLDRPDGMAAMFAQLMFTTRFRR